MKHVAKKYFTSEIRPTLLNISLRNSINTSKHFPQKFDQHLYFEHLLCFVNFCNFRTLDIFKRSWFATAAIWNGLPADLIL